ncbi:lipase maturation factor family protein [Sandaracinus amylolyticus]|uniref:Lipase maturation factor 2 n=1 Tax=Sandaracinus amylolyticus TaxID=927083 RepID=A0A0F6W7G1_9BACT|nr:lipase maturation factor family protein [Sandaracinus amylolyticus]AKF09202.1 putative integral membrane protein [Sandaracinus amylolyticus]
MRSSYARSTWLFARLVGVTSLGAFVSAHAQLHGLFGEAGILPLAPRLARVQAAMGDDVWWTRPTLLLSTGASDDALSALCVVGELASLMLALGVLPGPSAVVAALGYVSIVNVGAPFFPLQWDTLLIETLWLTALVAPWRTVLATPARASEPPHVARWALWLLVARLMLASGIVKWVGDEVWRDLSALSFHYETQPLPSPLSPWMHAGPRWTHTLGAIVTFVIELALPFFVIAGRRARHVAAAGFLLLQGLIAITGNYGFFNLLAIALCVPLLDDAVIDRVLPARWRAPGVAAARPWQVVAPSAIASLLIVLQIAQFASSLGAPVRDEIATMMERSHAIWATSSYGLFADMTTERPELVIEGSVDGETWVAYDFRYKPGDDLAEGLPITLTHMPRVDWMLWFAALTGPEGAPWVRALQIALLERRAPVLALLERDPFDGAAPRFVRVIEWDYELAPPGGDATWTRSRPRPWGRVVRAR